MQVQFKILDKTLQFAQELTYELLKDLGELKAIG